MLMRVSLMNFMTHVLALLVCDAGRLAQVAGKVWQELIAQVSEGSERTGT
jgi:hypothetical protein